MSILSPALPEPTSAAREKALRLLERSLGPSKVLTDPDACAGFGRDESEAEGAVPFAVVRAESQSDISKALAVAREAEVPITPRAAGLGF